ncbi:Vacuolar amino acid transporter 3 [Phytophthora nicotianae]|uniref:Vacuolar amino acid transporter 3 n=1 Tax=Phytophthora nicotianae TaxID=4792 RepID=A0A0W8DQQ5_PHYNI|nr:Vacuolar amino acid transporter 3 [Phytophthora nicotianae]
MGSLLSLMFVNQALYFDSIRDCYEAFVVYSFLALVLSFAGGESVCVLKMQSEPDIRHPHHERTDFRLEGLYPVRRDGILRLRPLTGLQLESIQENLDRLPDSEVLNNMKEVLSLSDILADAYHNFMPSYKDYMLQRGGESTGRARKGHSSTGFGDASSSEGSPTPMAHNNARVPRFVIDDEDDDEMEEIDLESNASTVTTSAELSTKDKLPELRLPERKEADSSETGADVIMANPQDDDQAKAVEDAALEEGVSNQRPADDAAPVETPTRQRSNSSPTAASAHERTRHSEESATL